MKNFLTTASWMDWWNVLKFIIIYGMIYTGGRVRVSEFRNWLVLQAKKMGKRSLLKEKKVIFNGFQWFNKRLRGCSFN